MKIVTIYKLTFSGLNECDGEAVDGATAPATVLIISATVRSLLSDVVVVGLVEFGEAYNEKVIKYCNEFIIQFSIIYIIPILHIDFMF